MARIRGEVEGLLQRARAAAGEVPERLRAAWGVKIGTLDNPGWSVEINLQGTALEHAPFAEHKDRSEHETEWMICRRDGQTFQIDCGPERLEAALQVFLDWGDSIEDAG